MKIDWSAMDWRVWSRDDESWQLESWDEKSADERAYETAVAWDQWIIASCVERNGGHQWWLDWDEDDGLWLHCQHCPAGVHELYPDGQDLIDGELPLLSGEKLVIAGGTVQGHPCKSYSGPVKAEVWEEKSYSWEYGAWERNAGIILEAAQC